MELQQLLQLASSYWSTATLHAGVKLDVFTKLATETQTAEELANIMGADHRGLSMLLRGLTALGLLNYASGAFSCTEFSRAWLVKGSPHYMGHIIMHHYHLVNSWHHLDQAVMQGTPVRPRISHEAAEQERESFLMGMFNLASLIAPQIASQVDLRGCRRLLDLAGGPGTYALHFCKQHPELHADIFDLPTTKPFAERTIQGFGLSDRVQFIAGDITHDTPDNRYDAVWISHLLHSEGPESCAAIVRKAVACLHAGGQLLIQEFILEDTKVAPLFPALFSLNMLVGTPTGQAYSQSELAEMMTAAGLTDVRRLQLELPNGAGVMTGRKP